LSPAFAIVEMLWILNGRKDSAFINPWNPIYQKFAGKGDEYHGAYGFRLRHHFGIDQIERAYEVLLNNPEGRQVVLQIWDPNADLPAISGNPVAEDIPCNICSLVKVRNNKLEWFQVLRSNDLFRGMPYNFIQFTFLQEILAGWLGVEPGSYHHLSDSLHVYEKDREKILMSEPLNSDLNTDSLCLPKSDSERILGELDRRIEAMSSTNITDKELIHLTKFEGCPAAFQNLLLLVGADGARRKFSLSLAQELMSLCTNPALQQLWVRWVARHRTYQNR